MNTEIEEIEIELDHAKKLAARGEAIDRLYKNSDFKALISEGYFRDEAVRLVQCKANPASVYQTAEAQARIIKDIDAIGSLAQYFYATQQQALMAREAITSSQETLAELYNGED
jgi:hypothetical protein